MRRGFKLKPTANPFFLLGSGFEYLNDQLRTHSRIEACSLMETLSPSPLQLSWPFGPTAATSLRMNERNDASGKEIQNHGKGKGRGSRFFGINSQGSQGL